MITAAQFSSSFPSMLTMVRHFETFFVSLMPFYAWSVRRCLSVAARMPKVSKTNLPHRHHRNLRSSRSASGRDNGSRNGSFSGAVSGTSVTVSSSCSHDASLLSLADCIVQSLEERADAKTKAWFTNYVKGSEWIGCKVPTVRSAVRDVMESASRNTRSGNNEEGNLTATKKRKLREEDDEKTTELPHDEIMDSAMRLLQHRACDAKLAGMLLLSEHYPIEELATAGTLDRFDRDLWTADGAYSSNVIADWSTADWFSNKVLSKMVFCGASRKGRGTSKKRAGIDQAIQHDIQRRVLGYASLPRASLWHRRCGIVAFLQYRKHRDILFPDFGRRLVEACEANLTTSPNERFTQTGIAWVLRYVLATSDDQHTPAKDERDLALDFVCRHGFVWTKEAKKSFCEKMAETDPRRQRIMSLS